MENLAHNLDDGNDANSTSPTSTPIKVSSQRTGSASGHTLSMKRLRVSPPIPTPSSTRRRKDDGRTEAIYELVELGKKRTEIAQTLMQRELQGRPKIHSIEECMERLSNVAQLSPDGVLAICEALKDERNRPIFMALNGDLLYMWIDRQIAMHQIFTGLRPIAPSFPPTGPFFPTTAPSFAPGPSSFPPTTAAFSPGPSFSTSTAMFPAAAPPGPSAFPPEGPSIPPN